MPDEQQVQATLASSRKYNKKKNTTTARHLTRQSITVILTEEKRSNPTNLHMKKFTCSGTLTECACAYVRKEVSDRGIYKKCTHTEAGNSEFPRVLVPYTGSVS